MHHHTKLINRSDSQTLCPINVLSLLVFSLTRSALDRAHVPPTKVFRRLAVNKTILKRVDNTYTWNFPAVVKFRVAAHII